MVTALALLRDEMQGEACGDYLDLRKGFNAAARPQLSLENASPAKQQRSITN